MTKSFTFILSLNILQRK